MVWSAHQAQWLQSDVIAMVDLTLTRRPRPSEVLHECRNKVLHRLGSSHEHEEEALRPHSPVAACHLERDPVRNILSSATLGQVDAVNCQSVAGEDALFFGQESPAVGGIVGHEEVNGDGCAD